MSVHERSLDLLQARWFVITGKDTQAVELLEHVARARSDSAEEIDQSARAFRLLGVLHAEAENWERAADAFEQASALRPESVSSLLAAAEACVRANRFAKAV